ncbi:MAG: hypothetical protein ABWX60_07760, partial [Aeromicrobium sp.]
MPEYLAPGVYVEEIERGPRPIEGVATSTAAFLGAAERGPSRPRLVTNYGEYVRHFGGIFDDAGYLPYTVRGFFDNGGRRAYIARISGANAVRATITVAGLSLRATGVGASYNRVWISIDEGTTKGPNQEVLGFRLRIWYWDKAQDGVPYDRGAVQPGQPLPGPEASASEVFDDLRLDPDSPSYFLKRVNGTNPVAGGNSSFVEFVEGAAVPASVAGIAGSAALEGGVDDNVLTVGDYEGGADDPNDRTGLAALALDRYRDVAIVHAPAAEQAVAKAVVTHCELNRFRFAVIDAPSDQGVSSALEPRDTVQDTQYGAFYYPWLFISDPRNGARKKVPPGGSVCGIYALSDNTTGVWKA